MPDITSTTSGGVGLLTLEEICAYCNNWFSTGIISGDFTIENGVLTSVSDTLLSSQYYRIIGSVFNDGLHQRDCENDTLTDEVFTGSVWRLAIPRAVLSLAVEIKNWQDTYGASAVSPFVSESFSGYSYTKVSGGASGTSDTVTDWRTVFRARLNRWRKY